MSEFKDRVLDSAWSNFTDEQLKILNSDASIESWLSEFNKKSTRHQYASRLVRFLQATNVSIADIRKMDSKEIKKLFLTFQAEQTKKGFKNNGILSIITAIRSYLLTIDKVVTFRKGQLLNLEADNNSHAFTNGDLKLLFEVGNTFEKALIATAVSEGWEISAFLEQDRDVITKRLAHATQNSEKFIFFTNTRQKTGVARFCVLNPLAIEWLTKYLASRKDDDARLFPITQDGVQKLLYRLSEQSGLKTTGSLRFHNIRKWLMSRLSRCGFNEFQIKYLMGKSINISDSTYLQTLQSEIEDKYPIVYNDYLNIDFKGASGVSKEQEKRLGELEKQLVIERLTLDWLLRELQNKGISLDRASLDKVMKDKTEAPTFDQQHNLVERTEEPDQEES
jgi:hypothetical protein